MNDRYPKFLGIHATPPRGLEIFLALLPFVLMISVYLVASDVRHKENPQDKLLPTISKLGAAIDKVAISPDKRSGDILLWKDTVASLKRLLVGIGAAACLGFIFGLNMGLLPGIRGLTLTFVTFVSNIPPLAILPILFISFGVDELGKVMLIFLGIFPLIARDIYLAAKSIPRETVVKAFTLGASQAGVVYRVILPQVVPRLIDTVRLSLGAAWLFLIASEAIASQDGLGYRIFLVRRYLSMDVIIVYVAWITIIAYGMDFVLRTFVSWRYPWYESKQE